MLSLRNALQEPRWQRALKWAGLGVAGLSVAAFGYIMYTQRATLVLLLQRADTAQLLPVVLWYTLDLVLYVVAWRMALQAFGVRIPLLEDVRIFVLANAARRLPGTLWYVGGRVALYSGLGVPTGTVLRASGLEAAMIWLSAALVALPSLAYRLAGGAVWTAAGAIAAAVLLHPATLRKLLARPGPRGRGRSVTPAALWSAAGAQCRLASRRCAAPFGYRYLSTTRVECPPRCDRRLGAGGRRVNTRPVSPQQLWVDRDHVNCPAQPDCSAVRRSAGCGRHAGACNAARSRLRRARLGVAAGQEATITRRCYCFSLALSLCCTHHSHFEPGG